MNMQDLSVSFDEVNASIVEAKSAEGGSCADLRDALENLKPAERD